MDSLVARARDIAERAHAGQVDKAGRPYIEHVQRVAAACADDPVAEAVALLHDVVEDHPAHDQEIFETMPAAVYFAVCMLDRQSCAGDYYARLRRDPIALRVKLADIADNADEERLALLDAATADRLRRKYAAARKALGGSGSGAAGGAG